MSGKIIEGMPKAEYLAHAELSKHGLDLFAECPEKYKLKRDGVIPDEPTDAMQFGTCVHSAVFEARREYHIKPETISCKVLKCPSCGSVTDSLRCRACKLDRLEQTIDKPWEGASTACKEWMAAHGDAPVLTKSQDQWISAVCSRVRSEPRAASLLAVGHAELSLFATCDKTGLMLKGRPDWCSLDFKNVVDLKTISNASERNCRKEIAKRRYHVQAAFYLKLLRLCGKKPENFYFIFVETGGPVPLLNVRKMGAASLAYADSLLGDELTAFAACEDSNTWPGYSGPGSEVLDIDAAIWALKGDDDLIEMEA